MCSLKRSNSGEAYLSISRMLLEQERVLVPGDDRVGIGEDVASKHGSVVLVRKDRGFVDQHFWFV